MELQDVLLRIAVLEDEVRKLQSLVSPAQMKKHVLTLLRDVSSEELQDMEEDELEDDLPEEVTDKLR